MSLFTQVKSQITTRQAAEAYGLKVSRNGMACCIFHDDRHPSMKIDERFYCFSCHATGDVIDFTAKLFGLSPLDAAKKLAADFGIRPLPPAQSAPIPKIPPALSERKETLEALRMLTDYEQLLKRWKEEFAPATPDVEMWDERFCQALRHLMLVSYAIDCLLSSDPDERKEMLAYVKRTDTQPFLTRKQIHRNWQGFHRKRDGFPVPGAHVPAVGLHPPPAHVSFSGRAARYRSIEKQTKYH